MLLVFYFSILSPVPDYVRVTIDTIVAIHKQEPHGDVLAFLTGQVCVCHPLYVSVTLSVITCVCMSVTLCALCVCMYV